MSVLATFEAVPSRVIGVGRYLLSRPQGEERDKVLAMLSPPNLGIGNMVKQVMLECTSMGLTQAVGERNEKIAPTPETVEAFGRTGFSASGMRGLLCRLVLSIENDRNHDVGRLLAWLLAQDPASFGGGWGAVDGQKAFIAELRHQSQNNWRDGFGPERIDNFVYWATYMGFTWNCDVSRRDDKTERCLPDPTRYLVDALPRLFQDTTELPVSEFLTRLSADCPVFEGGFFYQQIEETIPPHPPGYVSPALTLALSRLRSRGVLSSELRADAPGRVLSGASGERITHLRWKNMLTVKSKK